MVDGKGAGAAATPASAAPDDARRRVAALKWYHTIDVAPGVVTNGWFDLRHALALIPFPDVRGKRCLDIGTWDGFYAYELERRGAAEVVAVDVPDLAEIDYPPAVRADPSIDLSQTGTQPRGSGFALLHELLGSSVKRHEANIYDLDRADIGSFDVVVIGSLLVHLRDPIRALDAVRRITTGHLVVADLVNPLLSLVSPRRPLYTMHGVGLDFQWWHPNKAGLRHFLEVAGFEIEATSKPFLLRHGAGGPPVPRSLAIRRRELFNRLFTGDGSNGHGHVAFRARPQF